MNNMSKKMTLRDLSPEDRAGWDSLFQQEREAGASIEMAKVLAWEALEWAWKCRAEEEQG